MTRRSKKLFLATIASLLPALTAAAQMTAPASAPTGLLDLDPPHLMAAKLATLTHDLAEPGPNQDARDAAARQLLSIGTAEARSTVLASLRDTGNNPARLAAARAVADDRPADPQFIDALFPLLGADVPKPLVDATVIALGNYKLKPDVSTRLIDLSKVGHPEVQRVAAIRALAGQVEKSAAAQLVALAHDPSPAVATAATDGVREFASLDMDSPDDWWKTQADRPDADFRLETLSARTTRVESEARRGEETYQELRRSILDAIAKAPREQRGDVLISYLQSTRESVRLIAVNQAYEYATTGDLASTARPAVRGLLADSDPDVRLVAARTMAVTNDADALPDLARQLAVESDPRVRAELARTMGPIGNVDAVPILRSLLDDASTPVVLAASNALAVLGPAIAQRSATEAADLAIKLQAVLQARNTNDRSADASRVREALVKALVPLHQQSMLPVFKAMLTSTPRESETIRALAAQGVGATGKPEMAALLVDALSDDSSVVRMEAARALGAIGVANTTFENAEAVYRAMTREINPTVAVAEWSVIKQLLPFAPMNQLARWPDLDKIAGNDARLLDVYTVLEQKTAASQSWDDETNYLKEIGDALMRMGDTADGVEDLATAKQRYTEANAHYQSALDITRKTGGPAMRVQTMIIDTVRSLLRARDYAGAASFASNEFRNGGEDLQGTIGPEFKAEAERLAASNRPNQLDDVQNLIKEALAMTPALATQYRGHLEDVQRTVERRQHEKNEYAIPDYLQSLALAR